MARFRDILKAPELMADFNALQAYRAKSKEEKSQAYDAVTNDARLVVPRKRGWIIPFKADAAKALLQVRVIDGSSATTQPASSLATDVAPYVLDESEQQALVSGGSVIISGRFRKEPARLIYKVLKTPKTNAKSRFTNRPYKGRESDAASSPFGKEDGTKTEADMVAALTSKAGTWVGSAAADRRYYFKPEGEVGVG